jgi:hypothetical protein
VPWLIRRQQNGADHIETPKSVTTVAVGYRARWTERVYQSGA